MIDQPLCANCNQPLEIDPYVTGEYYLPCKCALVEVESLIKERAMDIHKQGYGEGYTDGYKDGKKRGYTEGKETGFNTAKDKYCDEHGDDIYAERLGA